MLLLLLLVKSAYSNNAFCPLIQQNPAPSNLAGGGGGGNDDDREKKKIPRDGNDTGTGSDSDEGSNSATSSDSSDRDFKRKGPKSTVRCPKEEKDDHRAKKGKSKKAKKDTRKARAGYKEIFDKKHGHKTRKIMKAFCKKNKVYPCIYFNRGECRRAKKGGLLTQHIIKGLLVTDCCQDCYHLAGMVNSHEPDSSDCECPKL